jgi:hypothetical protein
MFSCHSSFGVRTQVVILYLKLCHLKDKNALNCFHGEPRSAQITGRRQSEGGMSNFATEAASVITGRVAHEDQAVPKRPSREFVKVSFGALESLCLEPVESCRYRG